MNTDKNDLRIKREDLHNYLGKEIVIVFHTNARIEGVEAAWYKIPKKVKLLEFNDLNNTIKIQMNNQSFELNLHQIYEIDEA